jgi:(1->4)-alpha-D-glucan 1-alpha-D-glucosylmutase
VLLPVLGDHYGIELASGKMKLAFDPATGSFAIEYFEHRLPVDPHEYPRILASAVRELESRGDHPHPAQALRSIMEAFGRLPRRHETARARIDERILDKEVSKGRLASIARSNPAVGEAIQRAIEALNGRADDPGSFDALHELLERQPSASRTGGWPRTTSTTGASSTSTTWQRCARSTRRCSMRPTG